MTNSTRIRLALLLCYLLFAMLLNSVGVVILQVINDYQVSKTSAAVLEACKDLPIALVSFFCASLLPRLGYRNALQLALIIVIAAALLMPLLPAFWTAKLLFLAVGSAFALVKISVYALIGLLTDNQQQHASLLNLTEGFFMIGVLLGYWLFAAFIGETGGWLQTYWVLAAIGVLALVLVRSCEFPSAARTEQQLAQDFTDMLRLVLRPLVAVFALSAFLYVLIEQSIGTWLPTFNHQVLLLPQDLSVQLTSLFAAALAIGRIGASAVLQYLTPGQLSRICLLLMAMLILICMPLTTPAEGVVSLWQAPLAAYLLPMIGLLMAPLYPMLNSAILSSLPTSQHAAMTGLIVVFSALGGTTGSLLTGFSFSRFGGEHAFYLTLVPITLLLLSSGWFFQHSQQPKGAVVA